MPEHNLALAGQTFGRLTATEPAGYERRADGFLMPHWDCRCSCGEPARVWEYNLASGNTQSCGCVRKEKLKRRNFKHGARATPEYEIWAAMKQRCENPKNEQYADYGGRGIAVCGRWIKGEGGLSGFECFMADMGPRPSPEHTIERTNNEAGYGPDNPCIWALRKPQANNTRRNVPVIYQGRQMTLAQAAELAEVPYGTVLQRRKMKWPEDKWFLPVGTKLADRNEVARRGWATRQAKRAAVGAEASAPPAPEEAA